MTETNQQNFKYLKQLAEEQCKIRQEAAKVCEWSMHVESDQ